MNLLDLLRIGQAEGAEMTEHFIFPTQASPKSKSRPITLCMRESILFLLRADISFNVE